MIFFLVHQNHRILFLASNSLVVHLKLSFCFQFLRNDNGNESQKKKRARRSRLQFAATFFVSESLSLSLSLSLSPYLSIYPHSLEECCAFTSSGRNQPPVHMECHLGSTYADGPKPNKCEYSLSLYLSLQVEKRLLSTWNATQAPPKLMAQSPTTANILSLSLSLSESLREPFFAGNI